MKETGHRKPENPLFSRLLSIVQDIVSIYMDHTVKILLGALCVLVIILAVVLVFKGLNRETKEELPLPQQYMDQVKANEVALNESPSVSELVNSYYRALTNKDEAARKALFDDPSAVSAPDAIWEFVTGYKVCDIYVTQGIEIDELVVFVKYRYGLEGFEPLLPEVECFYLKRTGSSPEYKIYSGLETDENMKMYAQLVSYREPIRSFLKETEDEFDDVLLNDTDLNNMYNAVRKYISANEKTTEE